MRPTQEVTVKAFVSNSGLFKYVAILHMATTDSMKIQGIEINTYKKIFSVFGTDRSSRNANVDE